MAEEGDFSAYLDNLENENKELKGKNVELTQAIQSQSLFAQGDKGNLIQWQISTEDILETIENFLKGVVVKTDQDGNITYVKPEDDDLIILNEYGVNSIMQILGNYVNRNISLSFYKEERINEILADLGDELAKFILCNYEKMGMTTAFKKSRYPLLVLNILHIIESSYRRALMGREREELNTGRIVTQSETLGVDGMSSIPTQRKSGWRKLVPF